MSKNDDARRVIRQAMSSDAFREFSTDFQAILREQWREADKAYRRAVLFMFLTALAFEILRVARVTVQIDVGFVKNLDTRIALAGLPILTSYLYYEMAALNVLTNRYYAFHRAAFLEAQLDTPNRHTLSDAILPPTITLSLDDWWIPSIIGNRKVPNALFSFAAYPLILIQMLGTPVFICYAYFRLFAAPGNAGIIVWLSLAVSALLLIAGTVVLWAGPTGPDTEES